MFKISNFTDNDDVTVLKEFGAFKTIEWKRDLSVNEASAMNAYFASEMNVRRRQVICDLSQAPRHRSGRRHAVDGRQRDLHHRR